MQVCSRAETSVDVDRLKDRMEMLLTLGRVLDVVRCGLATWPCLPALFWIALDVEHE